MHPSEGNTGASVEMPRYVSHKKVWALEIATINRTVPGKVTLTFVDKGYAPLTFDEGDPLFARYSPIQRDFYVVYADGYNSFSPRKAFIEGYTREEPNALELGAALRNREAKLKAAVEEKKIGT